MLLKSAKKKIRIQIKFTRSGEYPTRIRIHSSTQVCSGNIGNKAKHARKAREICK